MSNNKLTYAAVVSSPPKDTHIAPQHEDEGPSGSSDAPPPYDGHRPKSQPAIVSQNQPPTEYQHPNNVNAAEQGGLTAGECVPPPPHVAKSRALRRFWGAFFWGWVIWIVVGGIIGGGVADAESNRPSKHRDHVDVHQEWMDEPIIPGYDLWNVLADSSSSDVEVTVEEMRIAFIPDLD
ncbi:hypothetical protein I314_02755 [Cryptococcus bacillisporus CA1873]|uniref:Uncharacterized protein n=1 Tax=Cryptococcus bacillisporus CA1873 TaxID=1296111 RepID=A0ABR5BCF8_CRYGA|nr:hypothetical protein I314_02755 [Cryptococcus bacillisporus CA1873]|eukprot:KIR63972.1 hypothetical protein I314_02755 [Cryptococcus gattii CA1873]